MTLASAHVYATHTAVLIVLLACLAFGLFLTVLQTERLIPNKTTWMAVNVVLVIVAAFAGATAFSKFTGSGSDLVDKQWTQIKGSMVVTAPAPVFGFTSDPHLDGQTLTFKPITANDEIWRTEVPANDPVVATLKAKAGGEAYTSRSLISIVWLLFAGISTSVVYGLRYLRKRQAEAEDQNQF